MYARQKLGRGFTLIELLVVVAIIALLIAILLPSLGSARMVANRSKCLANVRGMGQTMQMYFSDYHSLIAYGNQATGVGTTKLIWTNVIRNYNGSGGQDRLMSCPEVQLTAAPGGSGTSTTAWNNPGGATPSMGTGAYGYNGWMYAKGTASSIISSVSPPGDAGSFTVNTQTNPTTIPVLADAIYIDGWPRESDAPPTTAAQLLSGGTGIGLGRFTISRHDKSINIAFFDSHADNIKLKDLWTLRWHAQWSQTTSVAIPQ